MSTRPSFSVTPSRPDDRPSISRQLDELERLSSEFKRDQLGEDWFTDVKDFYSLTSISATVPSFRPRVSVPELQMFMLAEAADITDNSPVFYLTEEKGRDRDRERALRGQWRQGQFNLRIMLTQIWANLGGTGVIMVGFDPLARGGRGTVWINPVDPGNFFPDPVCASDEDWEYCGLAQKMFVDTVRRLFPEQGWRLKTATITKTPVSSSSMLSMPFGPMVNAGGLNQQTIQTDGTVRLRRFFTLDTTVEKVKELAGGDAAKEFDHKSSEWKLKFPNGRLTIDADDVVLYDGESYVPHRKFPFIRFLGMPTLEGFWAPPTIRYTRSLQLLAERLFSQVFENAIRTNNAVWLIPDGSGIDADKFGGLPGEIVVYNANQGGKPEIVTPPQFPAHFLQYPNTLLDLQKRLLGYTDARQGQPGAGNISEDLYEAAVSQASKITKLRSRFFASSVERVGEMVFYFMARFLSNPLQFPPGDHESEDFAEWKPMRLHDSLRWDVWLDPGSLEPMSATLLRKTALALKQAGLYDVKSTLEGLGIPNAGEIADRVTKELELAALTKVKKGGR